MPPSPRAAALRDLDYAAYRQGNYPRARQHFERALALSEPDSAEAATACSDLGATCAAMGDAVGALRHHPGGAGRCAAPAITRPSWPPRCTISALHAAGWASWDQAEACHLEALALWQESLGPGHPTVARAMAALGAWWHAWQAAWRRRWTGTSRPCACARPPAPPVPADIAASLDDLAADHAARQDFAAARALLAAGPGTAASTGETAIHRRDQPGADAEQSGRGVPQSAEMGGGCHIF